MRLVLTEREISAVLAAAGNIDPCMFEEGKSERDARRELQAYESGMSKLKDMLAMRKQRRKGKVS